MIIPMFSTSYNGITFILLNILVGIIIVSPIPCFLPFYTTIAFKSYIPLSFSERMFYILFHSFIDIQPVYTFCMQNPAAVMMPSNISVTLLDY